MKGLELVNKMQKNGWVIDRVHGSHYIMKKGGQVEVVPVHNKDLAKGLQKAIEKRTGLK